MKLCREVCKNGFDINRRSPSLLLRRLLKLLSIDSCSPCARTGEFSRPSLTISSMRARFELSIWPPIAYVPPTLMSCVTCRAWRARSSTVDVGFAKDCILRGWTTVVDSGSVSSSRSATTTSIISSSACLEASTAFGESTKLKSFGCERAELSNRSPKLFVRECWVSDKVA